MAENRKNIEQYLKNIEQNLICEDEKKKEIIKELESDIRIALEQGELWDEVQARMGTPEEIAEEFNDNFPEDYLQPKKKKVFVLAGIVVLLAVLTIIGGSFLYGDGNDSRARDSKPDESLEQEDSSGKEASENGKLENSTLISDIKEHSDYDKEAVVERSKAIITLVGEGDCETLRKEYTAEIMMDMMEQSQMDEAKRTICADWGSFLSYGNFYTSGVEQAGKKFVLVQVNVSYENTNVTFSLTLDEEMNLAGIYMM